MSTKRILKNFLIKLTASQTQAHERYHPQNTHVVELLLRASISLIDESFKSSYFRLMYSSERLCVKT